MLSTRIITYSLRDQTRSHFISHPICRLMLHFGFFAVFSVFILMAPVSALTWTVETVDTSGLNGGDSSLALDSGGNPHVGYIDSTNCLLKYAMKNGNTWSIETVDKGIQDLSLRLDAHGNPRIAYYTGSRLKYAARNGNAWAIEVVDNADTVGRDPSLALDSNGNPRISYCDLTNGDLKYAEKRGSDWVIETVDHSKNVILGTSIALDNDGNPHISYLQSDIMFNDPDIRLKYAVKNGENWVIETVEQGNNRQDSSLALDRNGNPHIGYYGGNLNYATKKDGTWVIDNTQFYPSSPRSSLVLGGSDTPYISYPTKEGDLVLIVKNGAVWESYTVDKGLDVGDKQGKVGHNPSLARDSSGRLHVSYFDWTNGKLKYAAQASDKENVGVTHHMQEGSKSGAALANVTVTANDDSGVVSPDVQSGVLPAEGTSTSGIEDIMNWLRGLIGY